MAISRLVAKNLHKSFFQGDKILKVLCGINFEFEKGKSYAITGVSGSGKSTLMHLLGGLDVPTSGTVFCDGQDLFKLKSSRKERFSNRELGFIFQFHYLIKELNVLENISIMGLIRGDSKIESEKRGIILLKDIGLSDFAQSYPTQLSGGQLQRVAILRAIFNKPSFLLADEPTGDLDAINAKMVINLISRCKDEWGMGIILCSHDDAVYNRMEGILKLDDGLLKQEK
ncbi:ABC transporter ATP-binding protein [Candidatus Babeliales bacterium]|nr:ABC transporter ATP-binding protein [Candidatus Babeliales bacterium]